MGELPFDELRLRDALQQKQQECLLLTKKAVDAQESAARILQADRQEIMRLQTEVHRLESQKLEEMKATTLPRILSFGQNSFSSIRLHLCGSLQAAVWGSAVLHQTDAGSTAQTQAIEELRIENATLLSSVHELQVSQVLLNLDELQNTVVCFLTVIFSAAAGDLCTKSVYGRYRREGRNHCHFASRS